MAVELVKVGRGAIGITVYDGKVIIPPIQAEDLAKKKQERIVSRSFEQRLPDQLFTALAPGMLGFWGGSGDPGEKPTQTFIREFKEETAHPDRADIVIEPEQIPHQPVFSGRVEQLRGSDGRVLFYVFALPLVDLTWDQMNELSHRQQPNQDLKEVPLKKLADFLAQHAQQIRPASLLAAQSVLAYQEPSAATALPWIATQRPVSVY